MYGSEGKRVFVMSIPPFSARERCITTFLNRDKVDGRVHTSFSLTITSLSVRNGARCTQSRPMGVHGLQSIAKSGLR